MKARQTKREREREREKERENVQATILKIDIVDTEVLPCRRS